MIEAITCEQQAKHYVIILQQWTCPKIDVAVHRKRSPHISLMGSHMLKGCDIYHYRKYKRSQQTLQRLHTTSDGKTYCSSADRVFVIVSYSGLTADG